MKRFNLIVPDNVETIWNRWRDKIKKTEQKSIQSRLIFLVRQDEKKLKK